MQQTSKIVKKIETFLMVHITAVIDCQSQPKDIM